ncbi:MAG: peptide MFS transporter [Gammaproteobacteria bacterium]
MDSPASPSRHPRGLRTLFFTEMWERMSYYGMRALLVFFMTEQIASGGMGLTEKMANAIYGLYTAGVYLAALPGGWVADRLLGAQRAVWIGGLLIAAGHFTLGVPSTSTFFLGLMLVVLGTGLLKPNISALVGRLYPEGGARRDSGFTLFYMGINIGALLGPLVCSYLGEKVNWHYGFAAAGVGMVAGLITFHFTRRNLGDAGLKPEQASPAPTRDWSIVGLVLAGLVVVYALSAAGVVAINPVRLGGSTARLIAGMAVLYFAWVFCFAGLDATEKKRVAVIGVLFIASAMFWSGFEQVGSSLNLFGRDHTQRYFAWLKWEFPAGWLQSVNPAYVVLLAPVMAALWLWLARRDIAPSLPVKFAWGLLLLAAGFLVMVGASQRALSAGKVWPTWLIATYLLHTIGELCLSPVGLSSVTKLAPPRLVGQMMGIWFLGTSLGNLVAGLFAGGVTGDNIASMPSRFLQVVITTGGAGLLLLVCSKPIRKLMGGVN